MNIMAQSDYLHFKKSSMLLKNNATFNELPAVLTPELYTGFTTYNLETTVPNTKNVYSRLVPSGKQSFLNIEKTVSSCPTFILCINTNTRPNRVINTQQTPSPIYKWKKTSSYVPTTCNFKKGFVTRKCLCSKTMCRCKTDVYP